MVLSIDQLEINNGERFDFGRNWSLFLKSLNKHKIDIARHTLLEMPTLEGKSFLDIGSGSGLSSLAARQAGARVLSFDYDTNSVNCTKKLKETFFQNDPNWIIKQGSVLDLQFLNSIGTFDIVYSWGVLHHTGELWKSFDNIFKHNTKQNTVIMIAIYNDQGIISRYWHFIKKLYCSSRVFKILVTIFHLPYPFLGSLFCRLLTGRLFSEQRGMSIWYDYIDWLGGFPFEVAKPQEIIQYFNLNGYELRTSKLTTRGGCNEFVFSRK